MGEQRARKMGRVVVLGFDGLEYDLVIKFKLTSLMQKEYGKVRVPSTKFKALYPSDETFEVPYTPIVWSAFVTGEQWTYTKLIGHYRLRRIGYFLRLHKIKSVHRLWQALGFKKRKLVKEQYDRERLGTIFDLCKSFALSVPTYNEERTDVKNVYVKDVFDGKMAFEDFYSRALAVLASKKARFLEALEDEYTLLMVHVQLADLVGHLRVGDPEVMFKTYKVLSDFTDQVKNKMSGSGMLLVVSDHGMEPFGVTGTWGMHSGYGFYSVNKPLNLKNPSITDFYSIIKSFLEREDRDKEKVMAQLKSLGYF